MAKPQITISVRGGLVQDIEWPPELKGLFQVVVQDFDDPDPDRADYCKDDDGVEWHEQIWADPPAPTDADVDAYIAKLAAAEAAAPCE